ncbi:hypothetical protein BpHYR1_050008, partial [Brachionus plicatilis]
MAVTDLNFQFASKPSCDKLNQLIERGKSPAFLRIYFPNSTAVVEKKDISLCEALSAKLKKRNLDISQCVAYIKDKNIIVDWNTLASCIHDNNLVISGTNE